MKTKIVGKMVLVFAITVCAAQLSPATIIGEVYRHGGSANEPPQIASDQLDEDRLSFVDRVHEYNEVPEKIRGAQYIMVANNDKTVEDYAIEVVLFQDATVYLFLDNRLGHGEIPGVEPNLPPDLYSAGMHWVVEMGFTDTGLDIGIDEGGNRDIDQWSSVFTLNVSAGAIRLLQQNDPTNPGDRNMYGVAVVMSPHFLITGEAWVEAIESGTIRGMTEHEWEELAPALDPNGDTTFCLPELYYYYGSTEPGQLEESGMVMVWGTPDQVRDKIASAWFYDYPEDPDLSKSMIIISVFPPKLISNISLTVQDIPGKKVTWTWYVGPAGSNNPIYTETWNLIVVHMHFFAAKNHQGTSYTIPNASSCWPLSDPIMTGFDVKQVKNIVFSETWNGTQYTGTPIKPPGNAPWDVGWNSWRELAVLNADVEYMPSPDAKTEGFNQLPFWVPDKAHFWGRHASSYVSPSGGSSMLMADNWICKTTQSVAQIRWWGTFEGFAPSKLYDMPAASDLPDEFIISIWTNKSASNSWLEHPDTMIWEESCDISSYNIVSTGNVNRNPEKSKNNLPLIEDVCYEFSWDIPPDKRWKQPGTYDRYWLSIMAVYNTQPTHPWGWLTRPRFRSKYPPAEEITVVAPKYNPPYHSGPPLTEMNSTWVNGNKVKYGQSIGWNLSFELIGQP
ncbi:hypothetical protein ACFL5F_09035 [Planctomycetota bacterium]